jgi:hypothetical protein
MAVDNCNCHYCELLRDYVCRFGKTPPSIHTEDGAMEVMAKALHRGTPVRVSDVARLHAHPDLSWTYAWSL